MIRSWFISIGGGVIVLALIVWMSGDDKPKDVRVAVVVPELSAVALQGQQVFNGTCAACHGDNASGSTKGPPLIHPTYRPGHHADGAVPIAIANGVRQHHWSFGPMPAQPTIDAATIPAIIAFIREVQVANGIK